MSNRDKGKAPSKGREVRTCDFKVWEMETLSYSSEAALVQETQELTQASVTAGIYLLLDNRNKI